MKKIIIAAAIILTTGVITTLTCDNNAKTVKTAQSVITPDKDVLGTAD